MITGSSGAISRMRRSQKSPSLPVLTPAEKFISNRTRSTGRLSRTERILFGFEAVSTPSNSSSRSSSREVSTLLLSSTIRIVPACIKSFSGKVIRFPVTLQASVKIFDTFGLLFCTNHFFLASSYQALASNYRLSSLSFDEAYCSIRYFLLKKIASSDYFPYLSFFIFIKG